jgi:hypothetical protein
VALVSSVATRRQLDCIQIILPESSSHQHCILFVSISKIVTKKHASIAMHGGGSNDRCFGNTAIKGKVFSLQKYALQTTHVSP